MMLVKYLGQCLRHTTYPYTHDLSSEVAAILSFYTPGLKLRGLTSS